MELDSTEMIKRFVLAGLGVGFMRGRALPRGSGGRERWPRFRWVPIPWCGRLD